MADHHPPPPLRLLHHHTATEILHLTTTTFFSTRHHLRTFLVLSFFLFSLRNSVDNLTNQLITTYIHNHPSLLSQNPQNHNRFFGNIPKPQLINQTLIQLDSFNPKFVFSSVNFSFKLINNTAFIEDGKKNETLNLPRHALHAWLGFNGALYGSYGFMILAFVIIHIWAHGVVFVVVVNGFLNRYIPFMQTLRLGANLGARRLVWYAITKWLVRDGWSRILGSLFFREVNDQDARFKIFIRLMFMPFSPLSVWEVKGFEQEIYDFTLTWLFLDSLVLLFFALYAWVAMGEPRRTWREVVEEACDLFLLMIVPATMLKCLENFACQTSARDILTSIFGEVYASMIQCFLEVYFMVAWMMLYLSVKSLVAEINGVPFGNTELEAMVEED